MSKGDCGKNIAGKIRHHVGREKAPSILYETECCIFRVPKLMRKVKEDEYTPMVVSIGPYHRKDERLHPMEHFKIDYLNFFLELEEKSCLVLESCVEKILEKEDQIRGSYAEHISLSRDDFVQMVLLDSVFIIGSFDTFSMFRPSLHDIPRSQHGVIKSAFERVKAFEKEIIRDLLLLENQLPLFIIDEIYHICYRAIQGKTTHDSFRGTVDKFFNIKVTRDWLSFGNLLALLRKSYVGNFRSYPNTELEKMSGILSPTASHLHAAGVKFKVVDHGYHRNFLEIQFNKEKGVLTIPKVVLNDQTQSLFRNMIAMEQCMYLYKEPTYITDYSYFLDYLINTTEDVQLLADKGIVNNFLGSDIVCDMFNTISNNAWNSKNDYAYGELCKDLNNHCGKRWNKWMATLKNMYFAHPWAYISVFYAIVLLLLTIAQVILAIMALP